MIQGCTYPPHPTAAASPPVQEAPAAASAASPGIQTAKMWIGVEPAPEYSFASRLRGPGTVLLGGQIRFRVWDLGFLGEVVA